MKKLRYKIEENLGKEFAISNQAEIWIRIPLLPGNWSSDKPVGYFSWFFSSSCFNLSVDRESFLTKKPSSELACVCEKSVSYQFFDQNPSFFIKIPNCSTWFCFTNTGIRKVAPAQLLTRQMLVSFTWKTRLWGFFLLVQADGHLFNQWCRYMSFLLSLNFE